MYVLRNLQPYKEGTHIQTDLHMNNKVIYTVAQVFLGS